MHSRIYFFKEDVRFRFSKKAQILNWIKAVIHKEHKIPGEINVIFCTDQFLLGINQKYLNHDYFTDIVTFDYSEGKILNGDIYISLERVKENSVNLNVPFQMELNRVIIHGILHLAGYADSTKTQKDAMRLKEDACLSLLASSTWN